MKAYRCCFSGHSDFCEYQLKSSVKQHIEYLITKNNVRSFWVSNYGNFDSFIFETLSEIKAVHNYIIIEIILPYMTKTVIQNIASLRKKSDNVLLPNISETTPTKFKILKVNQYMVDNPDYLLCYVSITFVGASSTLSYALKSNRVRIINLASKESSFYE